MMTIKRNALTPSSSSVSETDFIVGVTSVRFGHDFDGSKELLHFSEPGEGQYLPAIMDSGTSCLVMPGDSVSLGLCRLGIVAVFL